MAESIKVSLAMQERFKEMGYTSDQIKEIVPILTHSLIPVQRISDTMRETTQVGFNLHKEGLRQWMELVDPWDLLKLKSARFPIHLPLPDPIE